MGTTPPAANFEATLAPWTCEVWVFTCFGQEARDMATGNLGVGASANRARQRIRGRGQNTRSWASKSSRAGEQAHASEIWDAPNFNPQLKTWVVMWAEVAVRPKTHNVHGLCNSGPPDHWGPIRPIKHKKPNLHTIEDRDPDEDPADALEDHAANEPLAAPDDEHSVDLLACGARPHHQQTSITSPGYPNIRKGDPSPSQPPSRTCEKAGKKKTRTDKDINCCKPRRVSQHGA